MKDNNYKNRLKELNKNPGTLFGLLYPYLLVIILGIGIYYLSHMDDVAQQKVSPLTSAPIPVSDLTIQQPKTIPPVDVNEISIPTPELIEMGKSIYKTSCASCHGDEGAGAGPGSVGLNPAPRNFTKSEGWTNGQTVSGIYTTLQDGIPNSAMIAYDFLTPEEKFSLAHYIRSEFIADPPMDDEMDLFALDLLYNLSAGVKIPGQMPTESAMQLIVENNSAKFAAVDAAIEKIKQNRNSHASILIENVTDDLQLALSALENSNKWRGSEYSFIKFLTINVNQNGFNGNIFNLKSEEWNMLFNYFNNLL
jgi:mono/diheme cytochrome c family protein